MEKMGPDPSLSCGKTLPGRKRTLSETPGNALKMQALKTQVNIEETLFFQRKFGPCQMTKMVLWWLMKHKGT